MSGATFRGLDRPSSNLADEELVARSQSGDRVALETLIARYRRFARARSRGYYLVGGDADDLEQEALIGLFEAARDFRPHHKVRFRSFATLCITRQIVTAIRSATCHRHAPLNNCVSISSSDDRDEPAGAIDELLRADHDSDPAVDVVANEALHALRTSIAAAMSEHELAVLRLYLEGKTYAQIGDALGCRVKSIDNALQRVKTKLEPTARQAVCVSDGPGGARMSA